MKYVFTEFKFSRVVPVLNEKFHQTFINIFLIVLCVRVAWCTGVGISERKFGLLTTVYNL